MDFLAPLLQALAPVTLLYITIGVFLGITIGAIPGLTGSMLIALSLPFTFTMEAVNAIAMLIAMYVGAVSGSLITAVLMRMPGTAASVMTTFDGYPMTQSGKAGRAIGLGIAASFIGGIISWVFLIALAEPLSRIAVRFFLDDRHGPAVARCAEQGQHDQGPDRRASGHSHCPARA